VKWEWPYIVIPTEFFEYLLPFPSPQQKYTLRYRFRCWCASSLVSRHIWKLVNWNWKLESCERCCKPAARCVQTSPVCLYTRAADIIFMLINFHLHQQVRELVQTRRPVMPQSHISNRVVEGWIALLNNRFDRKALKHFDGMYMYDMYRCM